MKILKFLRKVIFFKFQSIIFLWFIFLCTFLSLIGLTDNFFNSSIFKNPLNLIIILNQNPFSTLFTLDPISNISVSTLQIKLSKPIFDIIFPISNILSSILKCECTNSTKFTIILIKLVVQIPYTYIYFYFLFLLFFFLII